MTTTAVDALLGDCRRLLRLAWRSLALARKATERDALELEISNLEKLAQGYDGNNRGVVPFIERRIDEKRRRLRALG